MYFFHKCVWIWIFQTNSDSDSDIWIWIFQTNSDSDSDVWIWIFQTDSDSDSDRPKNLKRKYFPKNNWREIITQKYLNKFSTQESRKKHSQPRDWTEESLPKNVWAHFKQNIFDDDMYLTKNSLKRYPCQTNVNRNLYQKKEDTCLYPETLWREVCTKQFSK